MMVATEIGSRINGLSGAAPEFHILGWSRVVQAAFNNLFGPARSDTEQLAAARIRAWKE